MRCLTLRRPLMLEPLNRARVKSGKAALLASLGDWVERAMVEHPLEDADASREPSRVLRTQLEEFPFLQSLPVFRYAR